MRLLEESDAGELTVEEDGVRITVRRRESGPSQPRRSWSRRRRPPGPPPPTAARRAAVRHRARREPDGRHLLPLVRRPDADPFVSEGDRVEVGQTLCILEAMKLFNEFKCDHAGIVRRVLVDNALPVEFGQPLFELAPL